MPAAAKPANDISIIVNTVMQKQLQEVIRQALPTTVSQDKFTSAVVTALKHTPDVFLECDRNSVYNAIVNCARDGLIPDGRQAALVPYNTRVGDKWSKRCQYLIMVDGIIDKLAALGVSAYAVSVYENDQRRVWNDENGQHVLHEPAVFGNRGDRIGAFACAKVIKSGATYVEAMNMEDLEKVKAISKSRDKQGNLVGAWAEWPDRMEQKTCLHRICRRVPNVEIADDEEYRDDKNRPAVTIEATPVVAAVSQNPRPAALQRVVDAAPEPGAPEEPPPLNEEP